MLTINVTIDLKPLIEVNRYSEKNRPILLSTAAQRYLNFLRARHIRNAAGSGQWAQLKQSTVKRKESRGWAENPEWILRESDTMMFALGIRHTSKNTFVGYNTNRKHPRAPSVLYLVKLHTRGIPGRMPARQVVEGPTIKTRRKMAEDIRNQYNKIIRRNRRGGK